MKKILTVFITILFLSACTNKTAFEKPKDLIPKDTMVLLITDLFIAKSAFSEKNVKNQRKINYMPLVYNKYKIDSTRFINSNLYYTSKFDEYDLIYKAVSEILTAKKDSLENVLKEESSNGDTTGRFNDQELKNQKKKD